MQHQVLSSEVVRCSQYRWLSQNDVLELWNKGGIAMHCFFVGKGDLYDLLVSTRGISLFHHSGPDVGDRPPSKQLEGSGPAIMALFVRTQLAAFALDEIHLPSAVNLDMDLASNHISIKNALPPLYASKMPHSAFMPRNAVSQLFALHAIFWAAPPDKIWRHIPVIHRARGLAKDQRSNVQLWGRTLTLFASLE